MAAGLVLALFPSEAFAFTWLTKQCQGFAQCDSKGLGNDGYENEYNSSHWGAYSGHNCTNYAAYRLSRRGIPNLNFPGGQGSAYNWSNIAGQRGYPTDGSPRVGDIAWFAAGAGGAIGGSGHVAYVESVDGNRVTVSEDNCLASSGTHCTGGDFDWRQYYISDVSGFIHFGGSATLSDGMFVSHNGYVYRIAGGAPLYVSTWDVYGGGQATTAISDAQFNALRSYPADGTFVNGLPSGRVFRFAGGAPEYVSSWSGVGGPQPTVAVDDAALDNADGGVPYDHVRRYPADGTFIANTADGRVYRVAGGAPLYVSTWDHVGGPQAATQLDPFEFANFQHLRPTPADMFLRGLPSGRVFRVVSSGHPYYVESWDPYGGAQPFLDVDDWAIDNCDHLACGPFGGLNSVSGGAGSVTVAGWAIDPNARTTATTIHVYVGGPAGDASAQGFNVGTAGATRTDVGQALPGTGTSHGFTKTIATTKRGSQAVYVYALNVGGTPGDNVLLGSKTVAIPAPATLSATPTPTISGTARVGSTLTANPGTWLPAPVSLAYQWLRNGVAVGGATKATLVLGSADLGAVMSVRVTGSKAGYASVAKVSVVTAKVLPAVVLTAPVPSVSGSVRVGGTLTVKPGVWGPAPVSLAYQWLRNGVAVVGATKVTYLVDVADLGKVVAVRVTGSRSGFVSVVRTSAATGRVAAGVLSAPVPRISGKAKVGRTLTVKPGTWKPVGVVLGVQWYRNGKQIVGATALSYKLVKADKGKRVTVKVTGSKPGYTAVTKTSKKTGKVKK